MVIQSIIIVILIVVMVICYYTSFLGMAERFDQFTNDQINNIRATVPRKDVLRQYNPRKILEPKSFNEYRKEIDGIIETAIGLGEFGTKTKLSDACHYALTGGKRLRPIILMEICRATSIELDTVVVDPADAALAVEYMHTASLIVDDAPAFDDDNERRGKPSLHVKNNVATAYMASLSLVSAAYQDIVRQVDWIRENCAYLSEYTSNVDNIGMLICNEISVAMGSMGAACGQFMDTTMTEEDLMSSFGNDALIKMLQLKTATFFEISFVCGWIIAGGNIGEIEDIRNAGKFFGTAYQIADDVGDMEQDATRKLTGKPGWNYANEHGKEAALELVDTNLAQCESIMRKKNIFTPIWEEIYEKVNRLTVVSTHA